MNPDVDYGASGSSGNGKLRQWLIEQVDCGKYAGLVWENDEKTIFRIPWKHAGKQDYNRDEDAALFKAWALFKGKYREGIDKPDPPTWKTRLRCALNKSNDFEELVERSQLDISDPYKVYHIIPEGAKKRAREEDSPLSPKSYPVHHAYPALQTQMPQYIPPPECSWRDFSQEQTSLSELPFTQCPCPPRSLQWQVPPMDNGYQFRASIYSYGPADGQPSPFSLDASIRSAEALPDARLHISVYFRDTLVKEVTTSSPEGCHITPGSPEDKHYVSAGGHDVVPLPVETLLAQRRADERAPSPLSSLERGVLCWMAPDGLYARRLCESRVYWQAGSTPYGDKPKKLEREVTCKLLHTQDYLTEIQTYGLHGRPPSRFQVLLSFGEECFDPHRQRAALTVEVEPLFARQLFFYSQQTTGHFYHSYEQTGLTEHFSFSEDLHRAITQHHSLQE
uniref:interferon regulatory factor 4-like isoform X1 n=1 Tax=Doryrhamphus excisus TaxID=161450 RepID=UPI0025ADF217|nr:interferon regulatory factor 4-like isoform X1 [Doryrhamphus excisus]XP_057928289.1 interferon regulatory factor 4-like isoform X1 [Doryrhamphus excisus]XP_057928290.1 interferon regulatory factor 4-like isoform X1 [Doryrhamphus excisus]